MNKISLQSTALLPIDCTNLPKSCTFRHDAAKHYYRLSKRKTTSDRSPISACCFFCCLLLAFALTSCKGSKKETTSDKPTVSVTIEPFRYHRRTGSRKLLWLQDSRRIC